RRRVLRSGNPRYLPGPKPALYGGDRSVCTFVDGPQCPFPGGLEEKRPELRLTRVFRVAGEGHLRSCPSSGELLMPQPVVRLIARRAMQVAIAAAGILVVLLVFSRHANAAPKPTAPLATSSSHTPSPLPPLTS